VIHGSESLEQAFTGSYQAAVRADLWRAGRRIVTDAPLSAASVSVDAAQFVRRNASVSLVDDTHVGTQRLAQVLATPGCEIRLYRGASFAGRSELLPVHWGVVDVVPASTPTRTIQVTSPDLAARVAYDRFPTPRRSTRGLTIAAQIKQLWRETLPRAPFVDLSGSRTAVVDTVWESDRNDAISKLAASIGCETFLRPDGAVVLRRISSVVGVATHTVRHGHALVEAAVTADFSRVRNHVVARAERADGTTLSGEWVDNDPASPTSVPNLGRRTGFFASTFFTTRAQCVAAARAQVYRTQGAAVTVQYTALAHPGVEAGERHDVVVDGQVHRILLDTVEYDLLAGTMTATGRTSQQTPDDETGALE
jgi:hypothetical protein